MYNIKSFKMKIQKLIAGLVLVFAIMFMVHENKSDLTGKIQDYSGQGILFSTLEVYKMGVENQFVYKVFTGLNGEFELPNLIPGEYKLVIKSPGFEDRVQIVRLNGKDRDLGAIQLDGNVITLSPAIIYGKA